MTPGRGTGVPRAVLGAAGTGEAGKELLWELTVAFSPTSDYFSAYLGEYRNVLSALETLNSAVLAAMDKTKLVRMGQEGNGASGGYQSCGELSPHLVLSLGCRGHNRGASRVQRVACSREM